MPTRRRLILAALLAPLAACSSLPLSDGSIRLSQGELQQLVARRFPLRQTYMQGVEVELTNPQLSMLPEAGRVASRMDAAVKNPLTGKIHRGNFTLSGVPQIDLASQSLKLAEPKVEELALAGVPAQYGPQMQSMATWLAEGYFRSQPLYQFPAGLLPGSAAQAPRVRVEAGGLAVRLDGR